MDTQPSLLCYGQWLVLCCLFVSIKGQNESFLANMDSDNFLYSPGAIFNLNYPVNTTYDYLVETNFQDHTILLNVIECEMEYDKDGDCLYDVLKLYDGYNDSAPFLDKFCCHDGSLATWSSTGDAIYLIFTSDKSNNYKGFKIEYISDGLTTTTSTTSSTTTSTTTTTSSTSTTSTASTTSSSTSTSTPSSTSTSSSSATTGPSTMSSGAPTTGGTSNPGGGGDDSDDRSLVWIIVGCCLGVIALLLIGLLFCCLWKKTKRPGSCSSDGRFNKRVLFSRSNTRTTIVHPVTLGKDVAPPNGVQTNIFDMTLPTSGDKANLLPPITPPLSSFLPTQATRQPASIGPTTIQTTPG